MALAPKMSVLTIHGSVIIMLGIDMYLMYIDLGTRLRKEEPAEAVGRGEDGD